MKAICHIKQALIEPGVLESLMYTHQPLGLLQEGENTWMQYLHVPLMSDHPRVGGEHSVVALEVRVYPRIIPA